MKRRCDLLGNDKMYRNAFDNSDVCHPRCVSTTVRILVYLLAPELFFLILAHPVYKI